MFRLDYLSCCLTILSTILVGRKHWSGLAIAGVNSAIICAIGLRTSQFGLVPANLFCIAVYALGIRSWARKETPSQQTRPANSPPSHSAPRSSRTNSLAASRANRAGIYLAYSASSDAQSTRTAVHPLAQSDCARRDRVGAHRGLAHRDFDELVRLMRVLAHRFHETPAEQVEYPPVLATSRAFQASV